jgi:hypothetical protein
MNIFFDILQRIIYNPSLSPKLIINPSKENSFAFFLQATGTNVRQEYKDIALYLHIIMYKIYHEIKRREPKYINQLRSKINPTYNLTVTKFSVLYNMLYNDFVPKQLKEKLLDVFSKAQRHYLSLNRFLNIYKHKRFPTVVTNDLSLNPLRPEDPQTVVILQNKSLYLFLLRDLITIIENALCNSPYFFASPLSPKNPYNNEQFSDSTLYNIYFKMKESSCLPSIAFHMFFLDQFNKNDFLNNNESLIRDIAINKYVLNTPAESLYQPILTMLKSNFYTNKLVIDPLFPKNLLAEIFRPFLLYYYNIHYTRKGEHYKNACSHEFNIKLKKFYEFNPLFGRKFVTAKRRLGSIKSNFKSTFNTDCIRFHNICINSYLNNSDSEDDIADDSDSQSDLQDDTNDF